CRNVQLLKEVLLDQPVLCRLKRNRRRQHRHKSFQKPRAFDRNILEFVGHQLEPARKFLQCLAVVERHRHARCNASHRRFRRRVKKAEVQPQRISRQREHVPELSSAENPDSHARFLFALFEFCFFRITAPAEGFGFASTRSVCAVRNLRNASRIAGCFAPRIEAASKAALIAPAFPIASVPTGIPPGICAIERSESNPFSVLDSTRTPSTGSTVFDAVIPGKCAAPPAPAIITSIPRLSAPDAYSNSKSGVRCAETTRVSCTTPSSSSVCAACCIVAQSEVDPMIIPTSGFALLAMKSPVTQERISLSCTGPIEKHVSQSFAGSFRASGLAKRTYRRVGWCGKQRAKGSVRGGFSGTHLLYSLASRSFNLGFAQKTRDDVANLLSWWCSQSSCFFPLALSFGSCSGQNQSIEAVYIRFGLDDHRVQQKLGVL